MSRRNTPGKYRKKPVVIDAMLYDGSVDGVYAAFDFVDDGVEDCSIEDDGGFNIHTLEGVMRADPGDWIIRGVTGEYYPCKNDIFKATYERVADDFLSEVPNGEAS